MGANVEVEVEFTRVPSEPVDVSALRPLRGLCAETFEVGVVVVVVVVVSVAETVAAATVASGAVGSDVASGTGTRAALGLTGRIALRPSANVTARSKATGTRRNQRLLPRGPTRLRTWEAGCHTLSRARRRSDRTTVEPVAGAWDPQVGVEAGPATWCFHVTVAPARARFREKDRPPD